MSFGLGRTQTIEENIEEFYRLNFESAEYKISIYTLFVECGVMLAKNGGRISYIIPDSFLVGMYFSRIRIYLLKKTKLDRFIVFNKDFWESGDVGFPTIFIVEKLLFDDISDKWEFLHSRCETPELLSFGELNYVKQRQINLLSSHRFRFRLFEESNIGGLLEKVKKISVDLDILLSLHHGIRSKIGRDKIISETKKDISWKKAIISSSEINRFLLCPDVNYINVNPELLFSGGWNPDHIEQTKILIQTS